MKMRWGGICGVPGQPHFSLSQCTLSNSSLPYLVLNGHQPKVVLVIKNIRRKLLFLKIETH